MLVDPQMALPGWLDSNRRLKVSLVASQEAPSLTQNCAQRAETYEPLTLVAFVLIPSSVECCGSLPEWNEI